MIHKQCSYHSDAGYPSKDNPPKWFRQNEQQIHRAICTMTNMKFK
jgi:hypothetical protein